MTISHIMMSMLSAGQDSIGMSCVIIGSVWGPAILPLSPSGNYRVFCVPKSNQTTQSGDTYYFQFYSFSVPTDWNSNRGGVAIRP